MKLTRKGVARGGKSWACLAALAAAIACGPPSSSTARSQSRTLIVGFGLTAGQNAGTGIQQFGSNLTRDTLIGFTRDGRPQPKMVAAWQTAPDGKSVTISLKPAMKFRNGEPIIASTLAPVLREEIGVWLGPARADIDTITAITDTEIRFELRQRSTFLLDALELTPHGQHPDATAGPYFVAARTDDGIAFEANVNYFAGTPIIQKIVVKPYTSIRSAWADMLRGEVDMLYEVGADALDLIKPSKTVNVFTHERNYEDVVVFNLRRARLRDKAVRRRMNQAINRQALISSVLNGLGSAASSPVWPHHWAYDGSAPQFEYRPQPADPSKEIRLSCIFADASFERLALAIQRDLQEIDVRLDLERLTVDEWLARVQEGKFDLAMADGLMGPNLLRPYLWWYSSGPNNWGKYSNREVDDALDRVRHAASDDEYRAGVSAFQRAIVDDPPAIFLAWSERARAVSTRFEVPVEPGRDVLSTIRLWKPVGFKPPPDADRPPEPARYGTH